MSEFLKEYKRGTFESIVFNEKDEAFVKRIVTIYLINVLTNQRTWRDEKPILIPLLEARPELKRQIEFSIIVKRTKTESFSIYPEFAYFEQKLKAKIPNEPRFKHVYLTYLDTPKFGKCIMIHNFKGVSQMLSVNNENFIERIGSVRQLTDNEFQKLIKEGIQVYRELRDTTLKFGSRYEIHI